MSTLHGPDQVPPDGVDLPAALARVEPEPEPDPDLVLWAAEALVDGRSLSDVHQEALVQGWDPAVVEVCIEIARVRTRGTRGVVTRGDIVRHLNRAGGTTSPLAALCRGVGLLGFASGLRMALANARRLNRVGRHGEARSDGPETPGRPRPG